jgi:hypothetical protein
MHLLLRPKHLNWNMQRNGHLVLYSQTTDYLKVGANLKPLDSLPELDEECLGHELKPVKLLQFALQVAPHAIEALLRCRLRSGRVRLHMCRAPPMQLPHFLHRSGFFFPQTLSSRFMILHLYPLHPNLNCFYMTLLVREFQSNLPSCTKLLTVSAQLNGIHIIPYQISSKTSARP